MVSFPSTQSEHYQSMLATLRQGRDLSEAMMMQPRIFPPLYISLIRAGERSGTLPAVLKRLGRVEQFLHLLAGPDQHGGGTHPA